MTYMLNHSEVIKYWSSVPELAGDIGESVEKVKKWKQRGRIPATSWENVVKAAEKRNFPVTLEKLASMKRKKKNS